MNLLSIFLDIIIFAIYYPSYASLSKFLFLQYFRNWTNNWLNYFFQSAVKDLVLEWRSSICYCDPCHLLVSTKPSRTELVQLMWPLSQVLMPTYLILVKINTLTPLYLTQIMAILRVRVNFKLTVSSIRRSSFCKGTLRGHG